jgi:hypothetical protein
MKSHKRLATLSLIIMALVSTPRAMQQLRHSINAAQERAGLVWWNLLLTPEASATESAAASTPCPKIIAARMTPANTPVPARSNGSSNARTAAAAVRPKADARTAQRQTASDSSAASELALNNSSAESNFGPVTSPAQSATRGHMLQKLASHATAPQPGTNWTPAKIQSALASLNRHDAPGAPPNGHIFSDMDTNEFIASPQMNALMTTLAKKGLNVQFRMKKVLDRNQTPRPRARTLISKDANARPVTVFYRTEQPEG